MHEIDRLRSLDLNLLVVLDALLATQNTTQAARQLGKTQSTVSHALTRARAAFGDPLLVRVGRGLAPTARAQSLVKPLRAWLGMGASLLRMEAQLDPRTLAATFTVIAPDQIEAVVLPPLVARLRAIAPNVALTVGTRGDAAEDAVRDGHADLFLGAFVRERDGLVTQVLYPDRFVVVVRRGHPLARGRLTVDRYCGAGHVLVTPRGLPGGVVDDLLARTGRSRHVAVRTASFATAAQLAATTDLVATLPASYAKIVARRARLSLRPVPLAVPGFAVQQVYRVSRRGDAGLAWLRGEIYRACAALRSA